MLDEELRLLDRDARAVRRMAAQLLVVHGDVDAAELEHVWRSEARRRGDLEVVEAQAPAEQRERRAVELRLEVQRVRRLRLDGALDDAVEVEVNDQCPAHEQQ